MEKIKTVLFYVFIPITIIGYIFINIFTKTKSNTTEILKKDEEIELQLLKLKNQEIAPNKDWNKGKEKL